MKLSFLSRPSRRLVAGVSLVFILLAPLLAAVSHEGHGREAGNAPDCSACAVETRAEGAPELRDAREEACAACALLAAFSHTLISFGPPELRAPRLAQGLAQCEERVANSAAPRQPRSRGPPLPSIDA